MMAKQRVVSAIDIGTAKICTLIAVIDEGEELRVVGASSVQSQGINKSQIVDLEKTTAALTESVDAAERMAGFSISQAFVSIGGTHIESQNSKGVVAVANPNGDITHEDVERVIEAARAVSLPSSREILHVIPTSYKVDSQEGIKDPVGMSGVRLEANAHIITGSSTVLKNIRKCIEHLGVQVAGFVFSGLASAQAVLSETEKELGVVLADVGAGSTTLCAFVEGALVYSGVVPVSATHITKDIALGSRVSIPAAERVKLALAHVGNTQSSARLPNESREDARKRKKHEDQLDLHQLGIAEETRYLSRQTLLEGIMMPREKEIFELIAKELKEQKLLSEIPAGIVLTGGGAETVGMTEAARKVLNLAARIGRPQGLRGLIDEIETPMYAASTGLLLYGREQGMTQAVAEGGGFSLSSVTKLLNTRSAAEWLKKIFKAVLP